LSSSNALVFTFLRFPIPGIDSDRLKNGVCFRSSPSSLAVDSKSIVPLEIFSANDSDFLVAKLAQEKAQKKKDHTFSTKKSESFAEKISKGAIDFESTANELGLDLKHTPFFSRSESIPGIGNLKKVKTKAFELDKGKSGWALVRDNYYLIRLQDRQKADIPKAEDLKDLRKKITLEKGNSIFQEWMNNLKERSEILIDKSQL
jgi:hypothetical protein